MPIKIPDRVLSWREKQRKGSIMRPKTFKKIKRKAKRIGYKKPSAVSGKAYNVTLLSKYLDSHPKDEGVKKLLSKLVRRKYKSSKKKHVQNPPQTVIYDRLLEIRAQKGQGKFAGQRFFHNFKHDTSAQVIGNADGSLTIRSTKGKPLWKRFNY